MPYRYRNVNHGGEVVSEVRDPRLDTLPEVWPLVEEPEPDAPPPPPEEPEQGAPPPPPEEPEQGAPEPGAKPSPGKPRR